MTRKNTRIYLNPSLALTFLIVALTGVMMLFHIRGGGIHSLHEWMSIAFLILCIIHLFLNWKLLWTCLVHGPIAWPLVVVFVLSAVLLLFGGGEKGRSAQGRGGSGHAGYQELHGPGK